MEAIHSGWLTKSPPERKNRGLGRIFRSQWRRRYFVLYGPRTSCNFSLSTGAQGSLSELKYYDSERLVKLKGSINLKYCQELVTQLDSSYYKHMFALLTVDNHGDPRTYHLAADSEAEMDQWTEVLVEHVGLLDSKPSVALSPAHKIPSDKHFNDRMANMHWNSPPAASPSPTSQPPTPRVQKTSTSSGDNVHINSAGGHATNVAFNNRQLDYIELSQCSSDRHAQNIEAASTKQVPSPLHLLKVAEGRLDGNENERFGNGVDEDSYNADTSTGMVSRSLISRMETQGRRGSGTYDYPPAKDSMVDYDYPPSATQPSYEGWSLGQPAPPEGTYDLPRTFFRSAVGRPTDESIYDFPPNKPQDSLYDLPPSSACHSGSSYHDYINASAWTDGMDNATSPSLVPRGSSPFTRPDVLLAGSQGDYDPPASCGARNSHQVAAGRSPRTTSKHPSAAASHGGQSDSMTDDKGVYEMPRISARTRSFKKHMKHSTAEPSACLPLSTPAYSPSSGEDIRLPMRKESHSDCDSSSCDSDDDDSHTYSIPPMSPISIGQLHAISYMIGQSNAASINSGQSHCDRPSLHYAQLDHMEVGKQTVGVAAMNVKVEECVEYKEVDSVRTAALAKVKQDVEECYAKGRSICE